MSLDQEFFIAYMNKFRDELSERFSRVEQQLDAIDSKQQDHDEKFAEISASFIRIQNAFGEVFMDRAHDRERISKLEHRVGSDHPEH